MAAPVIEQCCVRWPIRWPFAEAAAEVRKNGKAHRCGYPEGHDGPHLCPCGEEHG